MTLTASDLSAIWLTVKLASTVMILLLVIATPIACWLARTNSYWRGPIAAIVSLPLVMPPTVLGFYFLIAMGPNGFFGELTQELGLGLLPFTFWGLVVASIFYSMPFVVHPIQNAIQAVDKRTLEIAATVGASPLDTFFTVVIPNAKAGFITAAILGFTHTVGEFGVVLMIGGNIPGETQVVSIQMYEHVEALQYGQAHSLALLMVIFSFTALLLLYSFQRSGNLFGAPGSVKTGASAQ